MGRLLLPYGQNVHPVSVQRPWEDWLGNNGSTSFRNAVVHYVLSAETRRD